MQNLLLASKSISTQKFQLALIIFHVNLLTNVSFITEVDVDRLSRSRALEYIDLTDNPLPPRTHDALKQLSQPSVSVSERQKEDWEEDLF